MLLIPLDHLLLDEAGNTQVLARFCLVENSALLWLFNEIWWVCIEEEILAESCGLNAELLIDAREQACAIVIIDNVDFNDRSWQLRTLNK